jgi:hypothetical protein
MADPTSPESITAITMEKSTAQMLHMSLAVYGSETTSGNLVCTTQLLPIHDPVNRLYYIPASAANAHAESVPWTAVEETSNNKDNYVNYCQRCGMVLLCPGRNDLVSCIYDGCDAY